jgi:broad specificity phosphatase PhoE
MNDHPDTCEFFFIRHAPVVKQPGHVPPADPPIEEMPYALDRLTDLLPDGADWHVSPLFRAQQTADLIADACSPASRTADPALQEMDFGDWQDQPITLVWQQVADGPLHNWSFVTPETQPPHGESFAEMALRVHQWMQDRQAEFSARPQVVVCHGGVIRAAMAYALGAPLSHVVGIPVPHFGLLRLTMMDPALATDQGGGWLFASLANPGVVPHAS